MDVAHAIDAGDGSVARDAAAKIMRQTIAELAPSWNDQPPRVFVPPIARN